MTRLVVATAVALGAVLGAGVGCVCLAADAVLASVIRSYPLALRLEFVLWYAAAGALVGLVGAATAVALRRAVDAFWLSAMAAAALYQISVVAFLFQVVERRHGELLGVAGAAAGIALYGLGITVLRRITAAEHGAWAMAGAAAAVAVMLAVNRSGAGAPLQVKTLVVDAAVCCVVLGLALLLRVAGPRRTVAVAAVIVAGVGVAVVLHHEPGQTTVTRADGTRPPDLVLVIIDTVRSDVFEEVVARTPEGQGFRAGLDDAVWFTQTVATAPWTLPSVGSIMTGSYPNEHGLGLDADDLSRLRSPLVDSAETLAEHLQARGYLTVGMSANVLLRRVTGIDRGFGDYEILRTPAVRLPLLLSLGRTRWVAREPYVRAGEVRRRLAWKLDREIDRRRPLFLWVHLMDPHGPLHRHEDLAPYPAAQGLPQEERRYRDEVRYALREVDLMCGLLRAHDRWDDALVIVTSDHGDMFASDRHDVGLLEENGQPRRRGHGWALYDEALQVPLIIRPPGGVPGGRRVGALASLVDLFDTTNEMLDLGVARTGGDRLSLAPWLKAHEPDPAPGGREWAFSGGIRVAPRHYSLRTPSLKLIAYPGGERASEAYDLAADPLEQVNLWATDPDRFVESMTLLQRLWSGEEPDPDQSAPEIDRETHEALQALGYVD